MNQLWIILAVAFSSLLLCSCVSKSDYQKKINETEHLQAIVTSLENDYERLSDEKRQLITRNDELNERLLDARERSSLLQQDLMRSRADLERVENVLADRNAETGRAISEMRGTIDQLIAKNQALEQQLELELRAREARLVEIQGTYNELVGKLEEEIQRGEVQISELKGKLTVNVVDQILFDSGQADLKPEGVNVLQRIGDILKTAVDKEVQVEGHTDNIPIKGSLAETFPSNWELSTARATNVLHFLQEQVGISGERLSAVGYGEYRPVASNRTIEGRALNRRIQIVLLPLQQE
ncbi:MAG: OmpA family protein [Deltaproteobacteria bacterium]|nr:OmpA family protein [Deltaproteobacteria bacterium]